VTGANASSARRLRRVSKICSVACQLCGISLGPRAARVAALEFEALRPVVAGSSPTIDDPFRQKTTPKRTSLGICG
jgi:hypothetical protein